MSEKFNTDKFKAFGKKMKEKAKEYKDNCDYEYVNGKKVYHINYDDKDFTDAMNDFSDAMKDFGNQMKSFGVEMKNKNYKWSCKCDGNSFKCGNFDGDDLDIFINNIVRKYSPDASVYNSIKKNIKMERNARNCDASWCMDNYYQAKMIFSNAFRSVPKYDCD